ncbi:MAG: hypothetical protein HW375_1926, partial [Anaerolineales bacterium]|nr:hypothetical protein [Anaerolineales bacterium]
MSILTSSGATKSFGGLVAVDG